MNTITLTPKEITFSTGLAGQKPSVHPVDRLIDVLGGPAPNSGLLPPALRWFSPDMQRFVVERPPTMASIFYTAALKDNAKNVKRDKKQKFQLPLPWQVYLIDLENGNAEIYARPAFLSSLDDDLYSLPLPNGAEGSGAFCMGDEFFVELDTLTKNSKDVTLSDILSFFCSFAWTNDFNDNMGHRPYTPPTVLSGHTTWGSYLAAWEKLSVAEVLNSEWHRIKSLKTFVNVSDQDRIKASKSLVFKMMKVFSQK